MSDANQTKLLYQKEAVFATLPSPATALTELRFLSESLKHEKLTTMSEEIRSDRARSSLIEVGKNAAGSINAEFIVGAFNDFILAALQASAWTQANEVVTGDIVSGVGTFTRGSGTFSDTFKGAKFVHILGASNSGNNGIKRIVSMTDTVLTVSGFTADETGSSLELTVRYARNGVSLQSFLIEKQFLGMSPDNFAALVGVVVNQWKITMEAQARVMQTFDFMGAQGYNGAATYGDGSPVAASTNDICNTTGNIGGLIWDDLAFTSNVMGFEMTLKNNLRNRPAISRETTLLQGSGRCEPDGTLHVYFDDSDLLDSFMNHANASLLLPITDPDGNLMSIYMPHLQFPNGFPVIEGVNTDIMLPLEFNATVDEAKGFVIQIDQLNVLAGS